jgi:hypothetical protein
LESTLRAAMDATGQANDNGVHSPISQFRRVAGSEHRRPFQ